MKKASLVVLISGSGSNLQAIIEAINSDLLDAEIKAVISNTVDAGGLQRAAEADIDCYVIDHKTFDNRELFDQEMIKIIDPLNPDLVILAGFMRILSPSFIAHYHHRLINIHPSLLPKYKGLNTHQQAIENKDTKAGASVHYVSDELDSGPVVMQAEVPLLSSDTVDTLAKRVLDEEHKIYPLAIKLHCENKLSFIDEQLYLDNERLTHPIVWRDDKFM